MSNKSTGSNGRATSATERGDATRDRLLDALESIAADEGLAALSHRAIARRASLHTGLIHYHFGTVERLLDEALARRAQRLSGAQLAALSSLFARGRWTVEEVVAALWTPFSEIGSTLDGGWRNYLCLVARVAADATGAKRLGGRFDDVSAAAREALRRALPTATDDAIDVGLRFIRTLFEQESLLRCHDRDWSAHADDTRLTRFAAAGLRGLAHPEMLRRAATAVAD